MAKEKGLLEKVFTREKVVVTKELDEQQVLDYEAQGRKLFFDSSLDGFKELTDTVRRELSRENLDRYWVSYHLWKDLDRKKDLPKPSGIRVEPVASSADLRMQVNFKDPDEFHKKWHECWIRPDETRERSYRGYVPVESDEVEVFCSTPAGPPAIVDGQGKTEMLLYKIPNELHAEQKAKQKERYAGRLEGMKEGAKEQLNRVAREASSDSPKNVAFDPDNPRETPGTVRWHEEPGAPDAGED